LNVIESDEIGEAIQLADFKKKFRSEFEPIAQTDMLLLMLKNVNNYQMKHLLSCINEEESLCRRIDNTMPQEEDGTNKYYERLKFRNHGQ